MGLYSLRLALLVAVVVLSVALVAALALRHHTTSAMLAAFWLGAGMAAPYILAWTHRHG